MKTYRQTRDILQWLEAHHAQMAAYYDDCQAAAGNRSAAWLLDRMRRQEEALGDLIKTFRETASAEVLDTYFQYVPEEDDTARYLENLTVRRELTDEEATDLVVTSSEQFEQLYRRLADMSDFDAVREKFADMADKILLERKKTMRSLGPFESI